MGYNYSQADVGDYAVEKVCTAMPVQVQLKRKLEEELSYANANVARLSELLKLLQNNPETERIIELLGNRY